MSAYPEGQMETKEVAVDRPYQPTIRERLLNRKQRLVEELKAVDAAILTMDKFPGFEEVSNAIERVDIGMKLRNY